MTGKTAVQWVRTGQRLKPDTLGFIPRFSLAFFYIRGFKLMWQTWDIEGNFK